MGRTRVRRRLRAIGIATALAAVGTAAATASAAPLKVSVSYHAKPCGDAPARLARLAPVTAGTIELDRPGNGAPVRLSLVNGGSNPARANLAGDGPVSAKLILQTPLVRVVDGPSGTAPQRIGWAPRSSATAGSRWSYGAPTRTTARQHPDRAPAGGPLRGAQLAAAAAGAERARLRRADSLAAPDGLRRAGGDGRRHGLRRLRRHGRDGRAVGAGRAAARVRPLRAQHRGPRQLARGRPRLVEVVPRQPVPGLERGLRVGLRGARAAGLGRPPIWTAAGRRRTTEPERGGTRCEDRATAPRRRRRVRAPRR